MNVFKFTVYQVYNKKYKGVDML